MNKLRVCFTLSLEGYGAGRTALSGSDGSPGALPLR